MWKMIADKNSIEVMAISLRFAEPLSGVTFKKILRELERPTIDAGLTTVHVLQGFQFDLQNAAQGPKQIPMNGKLFQKHSIGRIEDRVENLLSQQLDVQTSVITFSIWRYDSWTKSKIAYLKLLSPVFSIITDTVALASFRVEFLDRFYFDGEDRSPVIGSLIRAGCKWVAPHVYDSGDLWHSHTGRFELVTEIDRELRQVNIDCQDIIGPSMLEGKRSIALLTAAETQFLGDGLEVGNEFSIEVLSSKIDYLHDVSHELFLDVISSEFALANGLSK